MRRPFFSSLRLSYRVRVFSAILFVAALLSGGIAGAQLSGKGEIKGTVTDPSGAVVAGASVTALQATTGETTTRTTNSSGMYDISPLDPGIYTVTVEASGFRKQAQNDVHVNALEIAVAIVIPAEGPSFGMAPSGT